MILSLNKDKPMANSGSNNMSSPLYKQMIFKFSIALLVMGIFSAGIGCTNRSDTFTVSKNPSDSTPEGKGSGNINKGGLLKIHTTTSIISDWVRVVGGERVLVESLTPAGKDPHTYQPTPKKVASLSNSKLVFAIGLSLEGSNITPLLENSLNPNATFLVLGTKVDPIKLMHHDDHDKDEEHDEHLHGPIDPHFWLDPSRVSLAIDEIKAQLSSMDPDSSDYYQKNASAYKGQLSDLDQHMRSVFAKIPEKDRKLVTSHEALGYLEETYGFDVIGAVIPAATTDSGPTAANIAKLIDEIKLTKVKGIFMEEGVEEKITEQIAQDANVQVITGLRVEYLKEGESYVEMMMALSELIHKGLN